MDDRELAGRLDLIQEKVESIEAVIQQYWEDLTNEREDIEEKKGRKRKVIKSRNEE